MNAVHQAILEEVKYLGEVETREVLDFAAFLRGKNSEQRPVIQKTVGVNGGAASLGKTRIAVWMLEDARRAGLGDGEILAQFPQLGAQDLALAWGYVALHREEIEREIRENETA